MDSDNINRDSWTKGKINSLRVINNKLVFTSIIVALFFVIDLFSILFLALPRINQFIYENDMFVFLSDFVLVLALFLFESVEKNGFAIYDVLVEELAWRNKKYDEDDSNDNYIISKIFESDLKIEMKRFISFTSLPLFGKRNSKILYFGLFLFIFMGKMLSKIGL